MPEMHFQEGHSHITCKALGRSHPGDLPKHAVLEMCLQNCARKKERTAHKCRLKIRWRHPNMDVLRQFSIRVPPASNWFETMLGKHTEGTELGWSLS